MNNKSIFEQNTGGSICYTSDVESRVRIVKECNDIKALKRALKISGLQTTVEKAINIRIRKLNKEKIRNER